MAKPLKNSIKELKENINNLKEQAKASADEGDSQAHNINIKGRANIQVAKNVGQPGGTAVANSTQNAPIDQDNSV